MLTKGGRINSNHRSRENTMSDTKQAKKPLPKLRPILTEEELARVMGAKGSTVLLLPPEQSKELGGTGAMGCPG